MKKLLFVFAVIFTLPLLTLCLIACNGDADKYHAALYNIRYSKYMTDEFIKNNRTYGANYPNADGERVTDKTSPRTRVCVIDNYEDYIAAFNYFPAEVDFETQMIVMHMFTSSNSRECKLKKLILDEGKLTVTFKVKSAKPGICDTAMPGTRYIAVVMDRVDMDSVEFIQI